MTTRTAALISADARRENLAGTRRLTSLALRRDRYRIPVWALSLGAFIAYFGAVMPIVYPDRETIQSRAAIMLEPSGAFMTGPGYGLDDYTFGAMISNEILGWLAIATALMSIFLVVRHTRTEEETGRAELIRANVVGRHSQLTAALVDIVVANAAVALVLWAALVKTGFAALDSLAIAIGVAVVGLVFGAVAALTSQVAEHSRTAAGAAGAVLGLAYVLRGVGDSQELGGSAPSWLSPIGWVQQMRAFVDLRWWPLLLGVGLALALLPVAYALAGRRDVGAGLVAARSGRPVARPRLLSPFGLAFRLERGSLYGWATGLFVFALLTGSMGEGIVESFEAQPQLAEVFGATTEGDVLRFTMAAMLAFFAMAVAVYAVIAVNRLRRDEGEGRTGAVLGTAISRPAWIGGTLAVVALNSTLLLLVSGFGLGAGLAGSAGQSAELVWDFTVAPLVHLPVVMAFAGLAAIAYGRGLGTWWVWAAVVGSIIVGMYGPAFGIDPSVVEASPFWLLPRVPAEAFALAPMAWSSAVAAGLLTLGSVLFRRRDLTA